MGQLLLEKEMQEKEMQEQEFIQIYLNKPGQQEKTEATTMEKSKQSKEALVKIKEMQILKTVILSDSKAAIQSIVSKEERDAETL
jgi:hypothetical protein